MVLKNKKPTISIFGCGWLGEPLAAYLLENNYSINGSTTAAEKLERLKSKGIEAFQLHLESLNESIISFLKADVLVINIPSKNVDGFKKLISFIEKSTIKKVIFVSSTSVYRDNNATIFEDTLDSFSDSPLLEIERIFQENKSFKTTILRFGGLFGYARKPGNFFNSIRTVSQPEALINMIHRDDCIEIITQIIEQNKWGVSFNACADLHPTKRDFYTKASEVIGNPTPNFIESRELSFKIISNDKIKKCLNYKFKHSDILKALEI